jgi:hypothetical protein
MGNTSINLIGYIESNLGGKKIAIISESLQSLQRIKGR